MRQGLRRLGLLACVVGLLVALALGLTASDPQRASTRAWNLKDLVRGALSGVEATLLVLGLVVLVASVVQSLRSGREQGQRRRRASLLPLIVLLLLLLLSSEARQLLRPGKGGSHPAPDVGSPLPAPAAPSPAAHRAGQSSIGWLVVLGIVALVVALGVALLARRQPPLPLPEEVAVDVVAEGLAAAAAFLRDRSDEAPRERVIGAYAAFEAALAARGVSRGITGTPTALLERAVEQGAPERPARELTDLFGLARFGDDIVTEAHVAAAEQALDALLATR